MPLIKMNLMCFRGLASKLFACCIIADTPKTKINNPNAKKFGDMVEHTSQLTPCKI